MHAVLLSVHYLCLHKQVAMKERDLRIDVLKGIGIICVIWAHLRGYFAMEIYIFHMPLFFFLSGMFYRRKKGFVWSRFRSLVIPFLLYSVAFGLVFWLQGGIWFKRVHRMSLMFPSAIVGPAWFLLALFNISVVYYLLDRLIRRSWLLLAATFAIALVFYFWHVNLPLDLRQSFYALPFYSMGRFLKERGATDFTRSGWLLGGLLLMFAVTVAYCRVNHFRFDVLCASLPKNPVLFYGGALSAILLLLNVRSFAKPGWVNRLLASFGRHSLAIMALHMPYMFLVQRNIVRMHLIHDRTANTIMGFFATFLIITAASYLLAVVIDRVTSRSRQAIGTEFSHLRRWLQARCRSRRKG